MYIFCYIIVVRSLGYGLAVSSNVKTNSDSEIHVETNQSSWWVAKQTGCEKDGGHLYLPSALAIPGDVAAILDPGESYWIGAMQYSSWKWTYDNTTLYSYTGYVQLPISTVTTTLIDGLTVSLCHLHCGVNYTEFGLQGRYCYCLHGEYPRSTPRQETRCEGNYEELCGDEKGMSIYEIDRFKFSITPTASGECVYARKGLYYPGFYYTSVYQDDDCTTERSMAYTKISSSGRHERCSGDTCVAHGFRSWDESEETHRLLKVTDDNEDDLTEAMTYKTYYPTRYYTYWIGLRRRYRQVWINGSDVDMEGDKSMRQACLCLSKSTRGKVSFSWRSCALQLKAICQKVVPTTPKSTSTTSQTGTPSDRTTSSPPVWSTSNVPVVENRTVAMLYAGRVNAGTAVGITLGSIAIIAAVIMTVLVLNRRQLLCFSTSKTKPNTGDTTAMDNKTYTSALDPDDHIYSIPDLLEEDEDSGCGDSVPDVTSHVGKHTYMNGLALSRGESPGTCYENQTHGLPNLHGYDHISPHNKHFNMTNGQSELPPKHVPDMADDYDDATKISPRDDDEYQTVEDVYPSLTGDHSQHSDNCGYLESDLYDLAGRVDNNSDVCEDVERRDDKSHFVKRQTTRQGSNSHTNIDLDIGGSAGYTPCYYNTMHALDKDISDPHHEQHYIDMIDNADVTSNV